MKEQPQLSENPEGDLFDWGKEKNRPAEPVQEPSPQSQPEPSRPTVPERDDLGWKCPQCELNNGWCAQHPRTESKSVFIRPKQKKFSARQEASQEEIDAFMRFAEDLKKRAS